MPGLTVTNRYRPSSSVRQRPAPEKFGIERRVMGVDRVAVAPGGVRLPDLDELTPERPSVVAEHAAVDDDALPMGLAVVLSREIRIRRRDARTRRRPARSAR